MPMKLEGLYVITDDVLTPEDTIYEQIEESLEGGANIVQLRDKKSDEKNIEIKALKIQKLCENYGALFILNDKVELGIKLQCHGLHIGKSDHHRFHEIRARFNGIIGVSCYGDIKLAKEFEKSGANYVAFGSFFTSPTKPDSNVVPLEILHEASNLLDIPICAIGGINTTNLDQVLQYKPHMISVISDIWNSDYITSQALKYSKKY